MPLFPQDLVHQLEVGKGARYLRRIAGALLVLLIIVGYNLRAYRNFFAQEAMDQAQLGRNIAEGQGYTTKFIRPFSMFLIKRTNRERIDALTPEQRDDLSQVKTAHPDISNPPVYPLILAGLMKIGVLPKSGDANADKRFWSSDGTFMRYAPDFAISLFNQFLLFAVVIVAFFLARALFDIHVASLSAVLLLAAEPLWRFSVSGLSTMLLLVLFMGLAWALVRFERAVRENTLSAMKILGLAATIGLLLGVGMLTRYAYGILLVPVSVFIVAFGGRWRMPAALLVTGAFALIVVPWIVRNVGLSGAPFGTAGYALIEASAYFPGDRLQRSLEPNLVQISPTAIWWKFFANLRQILLVDLPSVGGGFMFAFFLVGLMVPFRSQTLSRMRHFILGAMAMLIIVQAAGRTNLSDESPIINSENLLILLVPLVLVYGVGFFMILLDQMPLPLPGFRYVVMAVFGLLISLPLLFAFLPPRTSPVAFPPYYPPSIQKISKWMGEKELMMSDVPWAVAWYGDRQSILITLDVHSQFYALNDFIKPVSALYLTPRSLDARFLSQWARGGSEFSWGALVMGSLNKQELPPGFPLNKAYRLPEQLFFSSWERWLKPAAPDIP